jgi:hypothetical protein
MAQAGGLNNIKHENQHAFFTVTSHFMTLPENEKYLQNVFMPLLPITTEWKVLRGIGVCFM